MNHTAEIEWKDSGVPVSTQFDDPYFSLDNGLAETQHVFLQGNDLPKRFAAGFQIAELGFGTGLNFLASWALWKSAGVSGNFHFTSFEAFPMAIADMRAALRHFPSLAAEAEQLCAALEKDPAYAELPGAVLEVKIGDARQLLPAWDGKADAWFLDGFSPAKNPELWEDTLMHAVGAHTNAGGTAATYSAAGSVRRALQAAGFDVARIPGYGRKRHMTQARKVAP